MFKQGDIGESGDPLSFPIGSKVICIDEKAAGDELVYLQHYVVEDYDEPFIVLEGVKGEWHESRFILADSIE